ncbi:DUF29 domain-containing protein [Desulfococcaceae bacterium HSG8]|nr:DUF29 domain-containing protein [Desulfococcaceae bacterium HSG8]
MDRQANASYNRDFYTWIRWNTDLLRQGRLSEIDAENIAEELESMGKLDKRQLINRLIVLLIHLLKWEFQSERRSKSWKSTIIEQRRRILQLLEDSPSLHHLFKEKMSYAYQTAVKQASNETGFEIHIFPQTCPYLLTEQILDDEFYPE